MIPLLAAALTVPWFYEAVLMRNPIPYTSIPLWIGVAGVAMGVAYIGIAVRWKQFGRLEQTARSESVHRLRPK